MDENIVEQREIGNVGQGEISINFGENGKKVILIPALVGNIALAYLVTCENGSRHVMMSHYSSIDLEKQLYGLRQAKNSFDLKCAKRVSKKQLMVLVPVRIVGGEAIDPRLSLEVQALGNEAGIRPVVTDYYPSDAGYFKIIIDNNGAKWFCSGDVFFPYELF